MGGKVVQVCGGGPSLGRELQKISKRDGNSLGGGFFPPGCWETGDGYKGKEEFFN